MSYMKYFTHWIKQVSPVAWFCLLAGVVLAGLLLMGGSANALVGRSGWLLVIGLVEAGLGLARRPASPPRLSRLMGCLVFYFSLVCAEALNGNGSGPWLGQQLTGALGLAPGGLGSELALVAFGIGLGLPLWGGRNWPDLLEFWGERIETACLSSVRLLRRRPAALDRGSLAEAAAPLGATTPVPEKPEVAHTPSPKPSVAMAAGSELEVIDLPWMMANLEKRYRRKTTDAVVPAAKGTDGAPVMMDVEVVRRRVLAIHGGQLPGESRRSAPQAGPHVREPALASPLPGPAIWQSPSLPPQPQQSAHIPAELPVPPRGVLKSSLYGLVSSRERNPEAPASQPAAPVLPVLPVLPVTGDLGPQEVVVPQVLISENTPAPADPAPLLPLATQVREEPASMPAATGAFPAPAPESCGTGAAVMVLPEPLRPMLPAPAGPAIPAALPAPASHGPLFPQHQPPQHFGGAYAPSLELLQPANVAQESINQEELDRQGRLIQERLAEFKVNVTVEDACAGPVITRYEVSPAVGVRGAQVVNLMKDLARALGVSSIRVVETIPGKTCMGLELPNPRRQMICLSEVLSSEVFKSHGSKLAMALGKDITGNPVVVDLAKAPHLLVAGTTGSGKSVGVNAMIVSLLYRATPEEVRFIMIDPKMLELSVYDGIPHLLAPVVTDMKLAANALNWCVGEIERRYRLMSALGVRNLAGYNQKIAHARLTGRPMSDPFSITPDSPAPLVHLPFIVVVVDEFADLMMVAGKKIEELIARLAQKARAAGIHLILATQRPSVDVITGLIKANIPTRIAFQVSSKIDSRTILDQMGAEALLGQGDMLYLPPGTGYPQRVHGAFVADEEVHALAEHLKLYGEPDYVEAVLGSAAEGDGEAAEADGSAEEADPLYDEAVSIVIKTRRASISLVQRQLRIGYNRAARLVEQMEVSGVVSAMESNGNRTVLVPAS